MEEPLHVLKLELIVPEKKLVFETRVPLVPSLILESVVLLSASYKKANQISILASEKLTIRAFLKICEYCEHMQNQKERIQTHSMVFSLGIFGIPYLLECLYMSHYLDLKILKMEIENHLFSNYPKSKIEEYKKAQKSFASLAKQSI